MKTKQLLSENDEVLVTCERQGFTGIITKICRHTVWVKRKFEKIKALKPMQVQKGSVTKITKP
jgi:hypothetical protein